MSVHVRSSFRPCEIDDDVEAQARRWADRKTARFLDVATRPPFVAALEALGRTGITDAARVGLFTVSGWEPEVPPPSLELTADRSAHEQLAKHYQEDGNPTEWLRGMQNNALCQAAIVAGIRGPNCHFIGDASALRLVLAVASRALTEGAADAAIVVAYDVASGDNNAVPVDAATNAAAIVLDPRADAGPVLSMPRIGTGPAAFALDDLIVDLRTTIDPDAELAADAVVVG